MTLCWQTWASASGEFSLKSLRLSGLTYAYPGNSSSALDQISFEWRRGELVVLVGPSGSGKSTLAKLIKGLIVPISGQIDLVGGGSERLLTANELLETVGWTDAQPERQIFAATVEEEVGFALANRGVKGEPLATAVRGALADVQLDPDNFIERDPLTLSGGEKRRIAIASTIVVESPFLIFDEPEAGLDVEGTSMIMQLVDRLRTKNIGIMIISHDPAYSWRQTDRVISMDHGRIKNESTQPNIDWARLTEWLEATSVKN